MNYILLLCFTRIVIARIIRVYYEVRCEKLKGIAIVTLIESCNITIGYT